MRPMIERMRLVSFRWKVREVKDMKNWLCVFFFIYYDCVLHPMNPFVMIVVKDFPRCVKGKQHRTTGNSVGTFKERPYCGCGAFVSTVLGSCGRLGDLF